MTNQLKLAACPFCGQAGVTYYHYSISGEHHFSCECGVLVAFPVDLSPEQAVARWNERPRELAMLAAAQAMLPHVDFSVATEADVLKQLDGEGDDYDNDD